MTRQTLRIVSTVFAITLGMISLYSATYSATRAEAAAPGMYIALGDSVAAGIGSSLPRERGYAAIVAEWLREQNEETVLFENLAVQGETAATFLNEGQLQRFRDTVARARTADIPIRVVSVSLGGNEMLGLGSADDAARQAGLDAFRQNFATVLDTIRSEVGPDVPIVATTYYDLTNGDAQLTHTDAWWLEQFNAVIRDISGQRAVVVADVGQSFRDRIDDYTHYPPDVHPTNEGHAVIARVVWTALAVDREAPQVTVLSPDVATRRTPTLRFRVDDESEIASVDVSDERVIAGPIDIGEDEYVVLLDLGDAMPGDTTIGIDVTDVAGHTTQHETTIRVADSTGDGQ